MMTPEARQLYRIDIVSVQGTERPSVDALITGLSKDALKAPDGDDIFVCTGSLSRSGMKVAKPEAYR